jgi:formylglycine-generating enzyme required for sulfatase activity
MTTLARSVTWCPHSRRSTWLLLPLLAIAACGSPPQQAAPAAAAPRVIKDCSVCPELIPIPAGVFTMGSPSDEPDRDPSEGPQRRVNITAFLLGRTEVTQAQWRAVMGSNPSRFVDCGDDCPVEQVSWDDAQAYVKKLSALAGKAYRLPSEAEWEYAARAGTSTPFSTGSTITADQANFDGSYSYNGSPKSVNRGKVLPVGSFAPNAFGLHDMHGNVWEWVQDVWHENYAGAPADGLAWTAAGPQGRRVLRGGSFDYDPVYLRSAYRGGSTPDHISFDSGLRVARAP